MTSTIDSPAYTPVAVLGTLAEFHREPIPYDLRALVRLVTDLRPDLLCLDITPKQWQQRDFSDLPPEYRDALLPLAHQTDIVVVPIGEDHPFQEPAPPGWQGRMIAVFRRWLAHLQRTAPDPAAINEGWRHHVADFLYRLMAWLAGGAAQRTWRAHTAHLTQQVLAIARRDPGCRILVVVNVRHCHHIRPALAKYSDIRVVKYSQL
ncbi:MAG TPA: hypothetical protein VJ793_00735 [Anaerolineae bacterium]|nr:hypothetical protein [Anaerolineae bacterium]